MAHRIGAQFWFTSSLFEIEPGEAVNPNCFGKQLATWLHARLSERGYSPEPAASEDFGWIVMCARQPFLLWVGCANVDTGDPGGDDIPSGKDVVWSCFIAAEKPFFSSPFKKLDVGSSLARLSSDVEQILKAEPEVTLTEQP